MKDILKLTNTVQEYSAKDLILAGITHFCVALGGLIFSRAVVLQSLLPFGLSFLAGCSMTYTPAAAIGVFIGYFIPAVGNGGFRYIAALFAILAIKLLVNGYKKIVRNPIFLGFIAFWQICLPVP